MTGNASSFVQELYNNIKDNAFWLTLLGTLLGSGLAFGITLYFDRRTKRNEKKEEQLKTHAELRDRLRYVTSLIAEVLKGTEQQAAGCKKFIENLREESYEIHYLSILSSNDLKRILEVDSQSTFYAYRHFFLNDAAWLKNYSTFNSAVDYLEAFYSESRRVFLHYKNNQYNFLLEFKKMVDDLPDYLASELGKLQTQLPANPQDPRPGFLSAMIKCYGELAEAGAKVKDFDIKFLEPLLKTTLEKYQQEPFAETVIFLCKKARVKLNDLKIDSIENANNFEEVMEEVKTCEEALKKEMKRINLILGN